MEKKNKPVVLFVDDEKHNLTVFSSTFFEHYKVLTASSAKEAVELLKTTPAQVIITDQRMPEITGVEFLESIIPNYPDAIRMVLTGFSDIEAVIAAINQGRVYRYISKPWNEQELKMTIDGAIEFYELQKQNKFLMAELQEANRTLEHKVEERTEALQNANGEIQRQNHDLEIKNEQLVELNNEKNEFLGIAAHDLKNPLSNIKMLSKVLLDEHSTLSHDEVQEFSGHILKASEQMFLLITNLLDVNAIERGGVKIELTNFDVALVVKSVVSTYISRAAQKNITLHYQHDGSPHIVYADQNATYQVLDNLVSNAVKYSPSDKNIFVRISTNGSAQRFEVQDEGPGLSEDDKKKLFGKFARLSAQPTGGEHSTGLGLSIVKKMVDMMKGKIWCESELGKGATFLLELPAGK